MKEMCNKVICYYHDSKCGPGHKCIKPRLFLLEEQDNETEENGEELLHVVQVLEAIG